MLRFKSEEGGQQGDPAFPLCYAAATHAAAVEIDEDLKPHGGGARFFFDDGYIYGPKAAVFAALEKYEVRSAEDGEKPQRKKEEAWCPELGGRLAEAPELLHLKSPATDDEDDRVPRIAGVRVVDEGGVTALGVPIGSDAFVREAMQQKSQGAQDIVRRRRRSRLAKEIVLTKTKVDAYYSDRVL